MKLEVKKGFAGLSATIFSKLERYLKLYIFLVCALDYYLPPQKGSLKKALKTKKLWPFKSRVLKTLGFKFTTVTVMKIVMLTLDMGLSAGIFWLSETLIKLGGT